VIEEQRRKELAALDAAYAVQIGLAFTVLCSAVDSGTERRFDSSLANIREAYNHARSVIEGPQT
jgi:hypothetical protein